MSLYLKNMQTKQCLNVPSMTGRIIHNLLGLVGNTLFNMCHTTRYSISAALANHYEGSSESLSILINLWAVLINGLPKIPIRPATISLVKFWGQEPKQRSPGFSIISFLALEQDPLSPILFTLRIRISCLIWRGPLLFPFFLLCVLFAHLADDWMEYQEEQPQNRNRLYWPILLLHSQIPTTQECIFL